VSRDLTLRQLDLQEKSTDLQRDVANLNAKLARVAELVFYPASPCAGVVERVYVSVGDAVSPGDKIATIRADQSETIATALVDQEVSSKYARAEMSVIKFKDGTSVQLAADYVPADATDGTLTAIKFSIPQEYAGHTANRGYVSIALPLGRAADIGEDVYVPLDAVYQTQDASYVFVARQSDKGMYAARTQEVSLGEVSGSFVRVKQGIRAGDAVIVSRSVQEGDTVAF
jgi:multidrug efflux pump subunit AcrA (membrane-fusion protein)